MPVLAFSKSTFGAVVDVRLLPAQRGSKGPSATAPTPKTLKMLLDTGAEFSSVDESKVATAWGLYPSTFVVSQTLNGRKSAPVYELAITIFDPNGSFAWTGDPLLVSARSGSPFDGTPFHGVIGRDLLDQGILVYGGSTGRCTIAY